MVTRRVLDTMDGRYWDEPSPSELVFMILNYTFCIPVILAVGAFRSAVFSLYLCILAVAHDISMLDSSICIFDFWYLGSIYHFYSLLGNSTTIEGWEKDRVATMVRRGKIREVCLRSPHASH